MKITFPKFFLAIYWCCDFVLYRFNTGDDGKPVTVMNATLSYDGEAMTAVAAANFMSTLQSLLEAPQNLLLGQKL